MKKRRKLLWLLAIALLSESCQKTKRPISTYCENFQSLLRPDSTLPVLRPNFHMSLDSLGRSVQEKIGGDTCGRVWVSIPLSTGDTLPISIPYPICYPGPAGCVFHRALYSIHLNNKGQVLLNGDLYSLHGLAQQVPDAEVSGSEYHGGYTDVYFGSRIPSDSVYQLLQEVIALYHRKYELLGKEMYQTPFCSLDQKKLQVIRELHPPKVYLVLHPPIPPPPPPTLDSL